jgi:hypothetical protein
VILQFTYIIFVGSVYIDVELLVRFIISETHLEFFTKCWIGRIECISSIIIKIIINELCVHVKLS